MCGEIEMNSEINIGGWGQMGVGSDGSLGGTRWEQGSDGGLGIAREEWGPDGVG